MGIMAVQAPAVLSPEMRELLKAWITSSTRVNKKMSRLINDQIKVAKLIQEKLTLEITQLVDQSKKLTQSSP